MSSSRIASWMVITGLSLAFLIYAKNLLIPLVLAFSVWYLIYVIAEYISKIPLGKARIPTWLSLVLSTVVIVALILGVVEILQNSINDVIVAAPQYKESFQKLVLEVEKLAGLTELPNINQIFEQVDLKPVAAGLGQGLSTLAGNLFLVLIYLIFILAEQFVFRNKLEAISGSAERIKQVREVINSIHSSLKTYVLIKTGMSVLTGLISFAIMWAFGLDFAVFWAFLIFLLNFIPSIGSLVGTIFPSIFAILQFHEYGPVLGIFFGVGFVQFVIGNLLEPRLMGDNLNVSGLVVIIALSVWGVIWGVTGMVLSVPITVTMVIVMAQFKPTRPIAILLSEKGKIQALAEA